MAKTTYITRRPHQGDKAYFIGDERVGEPADLAHLVESGVLEEKKRAKPKNKAAPGAPRNKKG